MNMLPVRYHRYYKTITWDYFNITNRIHFYAFLTNGKTFYNGHILKDVKYVHFKERTFRGGNMSN